MAVAQNEIALAFWRLLPGNPIVLRVIKGGSRRLPHLWARTAYLLVLLLVVLFSVLSGGGGNQSLNELAKSSTQVFTFVSLLQLAMMCLLAPVFTAGAISQEKDTETFNVLLTTPLTNAQIVLGSLCSRLFFVIALLLSGLPIFCITMLFGGVTSHQIFLSFGIAGCTAVVTGSLAILISVIRVGTRGTIFSFYMGIAMFLVAGFALGMWPRTFVPESVIPGTSEGMSWLAPLHPFLALAVALNLTHAPDPSTIGHYSWPLQAAVRSPHATYMVLTLLVSVLMVAFATLFVRRGVKQGEMSAVARWLRFKPKAGSGELRRRARRVWSNPVAWREAVTRASAASSSLVRYSYVLGGIAAGILLIYAHITKQFISVGEARAWLSSIVLVEFVTVVLMATNTAATAITREREAETMELLLVTPLTSRYIIWGKLRGLVSFTLPLLAVPAATVLAVALIDLARGNITPMAHLISALLLPPLMVVYSAFVCLLGLQMSLKSKRSVQAVLSSMGIVVVVGFGLLLCVFPLLNSRGPLLGLMSPLTFVAAIYMVLNPDAVTGSGMDITSAEIVLAVGTGISLLIYGAIVAGMYKSMVTNFDMIVRKQSR